MIVSQEFIVFQIVQSPMSKVQSPKSIWLNRRWTLDIGLWTFSDLQSRSRPEPTRRRPGASRFFFEFSPTSTESRAGRCQLVETGNQRATLIGKIVAWNCRSKYRDIGKNRKEMAESEGARVGKGSW